MLLSSLINVTSLFKMVLALLSGLAVFAAFRHRLDLWASFALAGATSGFLALSQTLDFARKSLETYKLWRDVKSTTKTEEQKERIVLTGYR